jgi:hypothetical protein
MDAGARQHPASPSLPEELRWLFPEYRLEALEPERDRRLILARVLERGRLRDVRWALVQYGDEQILDFFRHSGCSELSGRTLSFWRAYVQAEDETWQSPPSWRQNSSVLWPT